MAMSNSEKQAAHRAKKESILEEIALSNAQLSAENFELRALMEVAKTDRDALVKAHEKKVILLEKKLLSALEKIAKNA
jgi:hypothetical protein